MTGYWLGVTVGLFLGFYIGIFWMVIFRIWSEEDKKLGIREG